MNKITHDMICTCGHFATVHWMASKSEDFYTSICMECIGMYWQGPYCPEFKPDNLKYLENLYDKK